MIFEVVAMVKGKWDVIVVGAGPAGSMAASGVLNRKPGARVLMVDKRRIVGHPYQCAGGIVDFWLDKYGIRPPKDATASVLKGFRVYATDGSYVEGTGLQGEESGDVSGRVLDRVKFDGWLADRAVKAGAELKLRHSVTGASVAGLEVTFPTDDAPDGVKDRKKIKGVKDYATGTLPLPPYLICADGWASKTALYLGVNTTVPSKDMYKALQYTIPIRSKSEGKGSGGPAGSKPVKGHLRAGGAVEGGLDLATLDREFAAFVFGRSISPTAYAWAFPEGGRKSNLWRVGTGCHKEEGGLRENLEAFIVKRISDAGPPVEVTGGWIPVGKPPSKNGHKVGSTDMYLIGDAGRIVCPLTGGGLANAFFTGDLAGECIVSGTGIKDFDKRWKAELKKDLKRKYKLKRIFQRWNDEEIARVIRAMGEFRPKSGNPRKELPALVRHVMVREPRLFMSAIGGMLRF